MAHLARSPALMEQIRREVQPAVKSEGVVDEGYLSLQCPKLNSLGDAVKRSVYLDSDLNITDLGYQLENLTANNITGKTIPTTEGTEDGQDVLLAKPSKVQSFIDKLLTPPASTTPTTPAAPSTTKSTAGTSSTGSPSQVKNTNAIDSKCIN